MAENGLTHVEEGVHAKPEIWVIDDADDMRGAMLRRARIFYSDFETIGFEKAEEAVAKLEDIVENNGILPTGIMVDGNLDKDGPEYSSGVDVVIKIRQLLASRAETRVLIFGISATPQINQQMIENGADGAFAKNNFSEAFKIITTQKLAG